jgi:hypothetical protein
MPTVKIPLHTGAYRNVDGIELKDDAALMLNGYVNEKGSTVKRPLLIGNIDDGYSGYPVQGLFWWEAQQKLLDVSSGSLWVYTKALGAASPTETQIVVSSSQPTQNPAVITEAFTRGANRIFYACGGKIVGYDGTTAAEISVTNAPTTCTHVQYLDGYLLAADGSEDFIWCNYLDDQTWDGDNLATAESAPDGLQALRVYNREIYLFGTHSLEIWANDGESPFSRIDGGFVEIGCAAPHSIVTCEKGIYWLGHDRHFRVSDGRKVDLVSTPYDKELSSFTIISDCLGMLVYFEGAMLIMFQFPYEQRTLVYSLANQTWSEWTGSDGEHPQQFGNWFPVRNFAYASSWNTSACGCQNGEIFALKSNYLDSDVLAPTSSPTFLKQTGHLDWGTYKKKRSNQIRLRVKRGAIDSLTAQPKLMLRINDDNQGWSQEYHLDLGVQGDREAVITLGRTGMYRTRQYEISCSDIYPLILVDAEEDIDILR